MQPKFEPNIFHFMFRLLNLLFCEWKTCQLEPKLEAKNISYIFMSEAYDSLNQVSADLQGPTKKWGNAIWKDSTSGLKIESYKVNPGSTPLCCLNSILYV